MFVIIKLDCQRSGNTIISVKNTYESGLNTLNEHIKNVHNSDNHIVYLETGKTMKTSVYSRGQIWGKTLLFCYQIIPYEDTIDTIETLTYTNTNNI